MDARGQKNSRSFRKKRASSKVVATFMIATEFGDLPALAKFPPALDRLGLLQVSTTLLFLLGGDEAQRGEDGLPEDRETGLGQAPEGMLDLERKRQNICEPFLSSTQEIDRHRAKLRYR
jgi:hypothetical protein